MSNNTHENDAYVVAIDEKQPAVEAEPESSQSEPAPNIDKGAAQKPRSALTRRTKVIAVRKCNNGRHSWSKPNLISAMP